MASQGLAEEAAQRRIVALEAIDELRATITSPDFVDLRIVPDSTLRIQYLTLSGQVPAATSAAFNKIDPDVVVTAFKVPYSVADMQQAAESLAAEVGSYADVRKDLFRGRLEATTDQRDLIANSVASMDGIPIEWQVGERFHDEASGGKAWGPCTAGFIVHKSGGTRRGLSTAGHCGGMQGYAYGGSASWTYQGGQDAGKYDAAWWTPIESITLNNAVACCGISMDITGRKLLSNMSVGDPVCKMGKVTNYLCLTITQKGVCYNSPPGCTYVEVGEPGTDASEPGDSGGPVFWNNKAFGWHVAGSGNYGLFMPQEFSDTYGFVVATS